MSFSRELSVSVVVVGTKDFDLNPKSVESVLTHTNKHIEVILVDNGSDYHALKDLIKKVRE